MSSLNFLVREIIHFSVQRKLNVHLKIKLNVKIISYLKKCFFYSIWFRDSIKYFRPALPELGRSDDGKQKVF